MTGALLETRPRPGVVLLTLNRPERRNALTLELMDALATSLGTLAASPDARAVVLTGAPPAFCAGGDLRELAAGDAAHYRTYCAAYRTIAEAVRALRGPLIAAVNGAAVAGGLELACLADLRVAGASAFLAGSGSAGRGGSCSATSGSGRPRRSRSAWSRRSSPTPTWWSARSTSPPRSPRCRARGSR